MSEEREPETGTEAWFKELENRLDRVRAMLGDAEIQAARAKRATARIPEQLSVVQEMLAKIEDRVALLALDGCVAAGSPSEPVAYRDVPGFPGYRAGSDGSVWGSRRPGRGYGRKREWRALKPYLVRPGPAATVSLYRDRVRHSMRVDAVILLAFRGEPPEGFVAGNKNGDFLDNRVDNLRYVPGVPTEDEY